ncbi:hypothetical protein [Nocardia sp. alder85J]|uniref:hypothetical protein n=1 Tax=Nocardia sp. alder85J TaxID=2862949 RepID=UPI001CD19FD4|nr:hypothetical protein [Nocardia sp. alder85J]MCX4097755.1 hypothetical protein [Nocardia sp. alder85J]
MQSDPSSAVTTALDWGAELRAFRRRRGESQQNLADGLKAVGRELGLELGCEQQHISLWERGIVVRISPEYEQVLRKIGAPLPGTTDGPTVVHVDAQPSLVSARYASASAVGGGDGSVGEDLPEEADVRRRRFLGAVAAAVVGETTGLHRWLPALPAPLAPVPAVVEPYHVARIRMMTATLDQLSSDSGGAASVDAAQGALGWAARLLDQRVPPALEGELRVAAAQLANTTAWACHDAGRQEHAEGCFAQALGWLRSSKTVAAQAHSLSADVLFGLSRVALHQYQGGRGSMRERSEELDHNHVKLALRYVQLGQIAAQDANDLGEEAQLHATAAWMYALMGLQDQVEECFARAEHAMGRIQPNRIEPWHQVFFSRGDWEGHRALVYSTLADTIEDRVEAQRLASVAIDLTTGSLAATDPGRPARSRVYDRLVRTTCQFWVGDVGGGLASAEELLDEVKVLNSTRAVERLPQVVAAALPFVARNSTLRDLMDGYRDVIVQHSAAAVGT